MKNQAGEGEVGVLSDGLGVLGGKGSCLFTDTKKPAGWGPGGLEKLMMAMPSLCGEAAVQFALLLGKLGGIHFAQALEVGEFPAYCWHVLEVRAVHQRPVRLASHEAQEEFAMAGC